jgi:sugar/nucleoside kinase (ribokinase family)
MAGTWPGKTGTICVLGDAHLDVVVRVSGPVAEETDTPAETLVGVGGQAANVAAWIAGLGGRARLIAARGRDPAAELVAAELTRRGVDLAGPVLDGRTGVVVSLSDGGRSRSMLTDRCGRRVRRRLPGRRGGSGSSGRGAGRVEDGRAALTQRMREA